MVCDQKDWCSKFKKRRNDVKDIKQTADKTLHETLIYLTDKVMYAMISSSDTQNSDLTGTGMCQYFTTFHLTSIFTALFIYQGLLSYYYCCVEKMASSNCSH